MIKQYEDFESFEWTEGMGAFMERMNFKARIIGMKDSKFFNPYGGRASDTTRPPALIYSGSGFTRAHTETSLT